MGKYDFTTVTVRMTRDDVKRVEKRMKELVMNKSEYIRYLVDKDIKGEA